MKENITIQELTKKIDKASTDFEKTNTELKRKYMVWNIEAFNLIASAVSESCGSFGTGYPFYALDKNLEGKLPIIPEQIRYNRELIREGQPFQKSIWLCESCIKEKYATMPDLKKICKPCPNVGNVVKPRKIINRLPDLDMWLVCKDGCISKSQEELTSLLQKYNMRTSDENPLLTIEEIYQISQMLKEGKRPKIYLPMDVHIIEYSKLKDLIEKVPIILEKSNEEKIYPYLPIYPISYRKQWQYDDEAYNFIYDYLSAFSEFNFTDELQQALDNTRLKVATQYTPSDLFEFLMESATEANFRRFQAPELEKCFRERVEGWKTLKESNQEILNTSNGRNINDEDNQEKI